MTGHEPHGDRHLYVRGALAAYHAAMRAADPAEALQAEISLQAAVAEANRDTPVILAGRLVDDVLDGGDR